MLRLLANVLLLFGNDWVAVTPVHAGEHLSETDLPVNLGHALVVGLGMTFGSKDDILQLFVSTMTKPGSWFCRTISSSDNRFVSGT